MSRFGEKIIGVGGFINISQNAKCVVFSGTLTAGDLDIGWERGRTIIRKEGRHRKFVPKLEQICYNAALGRAKGQVTLFVTERAVFRVGDDGLELIEIAPQPQSRQATRVQLAYIVRTVAQGGIAPLFMGQGRGALPAQTGCAAELNQPVAGR